MDFQDRFLKGFAQHLHDLGVGVWSPNVPYQFDDVAIVLGALPQSPDQAIALNAYDVDHDPTLSDSVIGLQVRTRGAGSALSGVSAIAGAVFDELHGSWNFRLPVPVPLAVDAGVWVVQCEQRSTTPGGQDANERWTYIQNFYVTVHRPSPHRT